MIEWFLNELSVFESSDIEDDDFDVYFESECGNDTSCSVSIVALASDAAQIIAKQQIEIDELEAMVNALHENLADFDSYSVLDAAYRTSPFGKTVVDILN